MSEELQRDSEYWQAKALGAIRDLEQEVGQPLVGVPTTLEYVDDIDREGIRGLDTSVKSKNSWTAARPYWQTSIGPRGYASDSPVLDDHALCDVCYRRTKKSESKGILLRLRAFIVRMMKH